MSSGRSIINSRAMASSGIPTASNTNCIPAMEPEGIPGAPMDAIIATKNIVVIVIGSKAIPNIWAKKTAATPSNRAVPSMLTVAPSGKTTELTSEDTLNRFWAASIDTGSVAALDEVDRAVTKGCAIFLKRTAGLTPPKTQAMAGRTKVPWNKVARNTTSANSPRDIRVPISMLLAS